MISWFFGAPIGFYAILIVILAIVTVIIYFIAEEHSLALELDNDGFVYSIAYLVMVVLTGIPVARLAYMTRDGWSWDTWVLVTGTIVLVPILMMLIAVQVIIKVLQVSEKRVEKLSMLAEEQTQSSNIHAYLMKITGGKKGKKSFHAPHHRKMHDLYKKIVSIYKRIDHAKKGIESHNMAGKTQADNLVESLDKMQKEIIAMAHYIDDNNIKEGDFFMQQLMSRMANASSHLDIMKNKLDIWNLELIKIGASDDVQLTKKLDELDDIVSATQTVLGVLDCAELLAKQYSEMP